MFLLLCEIADSLLKVHALLFRSGRYNDLEGLTFYDLHFVSENLFSLTL